MLYIFLSFFLTLQTTKRPPVWGQGLLTERLSWSYVRLMLEMDIDHTDRINELFESFSSSKVNVQIYHKITTQFGLAILVILLVSELKLCGQYFLFPLPTLFSWKLHCHIKLGLYFNLIMPFHLGRRTKWFSLPGLWRKTHMCPYSSLSWANWVPQRGSLFWSPP